MMIYTDMIHLIADDLNELHEFAKNIGLHRNYFHGVRKGHPHYDLTSKHIKNKVIERNVKIISSKDIVNIFKNKK
jgi:hypothetical protein